MGNIFCPPPKDAAALLAAEYGGDDVYGGSTGNDDFVQTVYQLALSRRRGTFPPSNCKNEAEAAADLEDDSHLRPLSLPCAKSLVLLTEHRNQSPFHDYEVLEVMGSGSMGEVSKVRRKSDSLRNRTRGCIVGMTRSARSCSSLRNADEISALRNIFGGGSSRRGNGRAAFLPACRRRLVGIPPSLAGTALTDATSSSEDSSSSSSSSSASMPSSYRRSSCRTPHSPCSVIPNGPIAGSPPQSFVAGKTTAILFKPETSLSAACGGILKDTTRTSFPSVSSSHSMVPLLSQTFWSCGDFGGSTNQVGGGPNRYRPVYYALKSIHLNSFSSDAYTTELRNEISILKSLDHPHIVRAIETYEHRRRLYLVLELCTGGDLYARDPYTEVEASRIVGSIMSAVAYMHKKGVVHRDLKYENVMFVDSKPYSDVKLIDFGLSKKYRPGDPYLKTGVGTIYSMAPEVFRGEYTSQADVWSIGVMAYMLLSSHLPFYGKNRQQIVSRIVHGHYHFKGRSWKPVSPIAKEFVMALLQRDPGERPTSAQALSLPWLDGRQGAEDTSCSADARQVSTTEEEESVDWVASSLRSYADYPALKKLALMVIAHRSTSMEIGFLQQIFHRLDRKRAGVVSKVEFKTCLAGYGYTDEEIDGLFNGVDLVSNGIITYTEFLAATIESTGNLSSARLMEAFDHFDSDGSGFISVADLCSVLGEDIPRAYVDRVIDEADLTEDRRISFEEFLSLW